MTHHDRCGADESPAPREVEHQRGAFLRLGSRELDGSRHDDGHTAESLRRAHAPERFRGGEGRISLPEINVRGMVVLILIVVNPTAASELSSSRRPASTIGLFWMVASGFGPCFSVLLPRIRLFGPISVVCESLLGACTNLLP